MDTEIKVGQIWRKQGPCDWLRIDRILDPEYDEYDGGCPGCIITTVKQDVSRLKYGKSFFIADTQNSPWEEQVMRNRNLYIQ